MKSFNSISKNWFSGLLATLLCLCSISAVHAQIFVTNYFGGTVGEYNADGTTMNASLLSGLDNPFGIAVVGSNLFVSNFGDGTDGTITEYNIATGSASTFASGISHLNGIVASGSNLFVPNLGTGTIVEYNTTTGASSTLVSGLSSPLSTPYNIAISVSGTDLFYTDNSDSSIGEYDLTTGTLTSLPVSGLDYPFDIAASGSDLFITNGDSNNTVLEYNLSTGSTTPLFTWSSSLYGIAVSGSNLLVATNDNTILEYNLTSGHTSTLISSEQGLDGPNDIVVDVQGVPEPSTWALMLGGLGALIYWRISARRVALGAV